MSMNMLMRRMGIKDVTVHGFRSSFRDWCGDKTQYSKEVAEAALAHKIGNKVEQAYRRRSALDISVVSSWKIALPTAIVWCLMVKAHLLEVLRN